MQGERQLTHKCGQKIIRSWIWDAHDPKPHSDYEVEDKKGNRRVVEKCPKCNRKLKLTRENFIENEK